MKIVIIHGPNMNLLGIKSKQINTTATLGKINSALKKIARTNNLELKIMQTHSQNKANKYLHSNRNVASGILLAPTTWNDFGYTIKETLEMFNIPFVTVHFDDSNTLFNTNKITHNDPITAYTLAIQKLILG